MNMQIALKWVECKYTPKSSSQATTPATSAYTYNTKHTQFFPPHVNHHKGDPSVWCLQKKNGRNC